MKDEGGHARDHEREHRIDDAEGETEGEPGKETPPVWFYI